ncbi:hypothetical protein LDL08_20870 [Nonomuraea glycinis]|uniref:Alpha/beta hydrolase n=1 Tax=Nonomuraea glycinis TaxID=2047744 RepID=A0A918AB88_9ACTN|nr:hypothetical protein [Nonomuraea glycinis]MCA2178645.1 hypothetical protein [Nonomuraea glycinis]WSG70691.1 hypothetical protein OHA68_14945 [Nonomuraea glycinis]GGP13805.1 hypothetical protein GCM10012278_66990 [Nonomuraea glycinis]
MPQEPRIDVERPAQKAGQALTAERKAELSAQLPKQPWFGMRLQPSGQPARHPDHEWKLTADQPYQGRFATGRAAVYLGGGNTEITRPFIFADGFNYGPSDLPALWDHFNKPYAGETDGFLDQLNAQGLDVILLGFDARHTHIQANAGVAAAAILRAIAERRGNAKLIVGGVSMGGMITRYALARLENQRTDHETDTYLSYDTPHNGAWTPLVLQQLAYFFDEVIQPPEGGIKQSELLRSPAAQQLLWGWVPDAAYSGPVAANQLRQEFLDELHALGDFPARPVKLGVANGTGDGTGRPLPPGQVAFDWAWPDVASAAPRIQPDRGTKQPAGEMSLGEVLQRSLTTEVPAFDGAPGGTLDTYGRIAAALGAPIEDAYKVGSFVPSASAVALEGPNWTDELDTDLSALTSGRFALDEFAFDTDNSEHSSISLPLVKWIEDRLAR